MKTKDEDILHKFLRKQETDVVYLERDQLDYSSRILRYIQKTKNREIKRLNNLIKSKRRTFELLVYRNGTNDGKSIYRVYGQEENSPYNAFLLGVLLKDNKLDIDNTKICIVGIIKGGDIEKVKELELNNLNKLYGSREIFKMEQNGDIVPTFPLSPRINGVGVANVPNVAVRQRKFTLPIWGCMEGHEGCISNCNYFVEGIDDNECSDRRCNFFCFKGRELIDCDDTCDGYVKISDNAHCCNYEFALSCGTGKFWGK